MCTKKGDVEGPPWTECIALLVTIAQLLPDKPSPLCIHFKADMCKLLCSGNKYIPGKKGKSK